MSPRPDRPIPLVDLVSLASSGSAVGVAGPDPSSSEGRAAWDFFENNWRQARDGLLSRTERIRVRPLPTRAPPTAFSFEVDRPYKRKRADGMVVLEPGPVCGTIFYRTDVLTAPRNSPPACVFLSSKGFYHPNFSRSLGVLCLGPLPGGPFPLDALLLHLYAIVSYQHLGTNDPLDADALRYFSREPDAFEGIADVPRLY